MFKKLMKKVSGLGGAVSKFAKSAPRGGLGKVVSQMAKPDAPASTYDKATSGMASMVGLVKARRAALASKV